MSDSSDEEGASEDQSLVIYENEERKKPHIQR